MPEKAGEKIGLDDSSFGFEAQTLRRKGKKWSRKCYQYLVLIYKAFIKSQFSIRYEDKISSDV